MFRVQGLELRVLILLCWGEGGLGKVWVRVDGRDFHRLSSKKCNEEVRF